MTTSTMVLDRAAERRTKYIQGLRELIALLESNPDLPAPYLFPEATVHTSCETDDEGVAAVARIADRLGVKVATSAGGTHIKAILTLPSGAAYEFLHISHGEMARYSEHMRKYHEDKAAEVADDALVQTAPLDVETAADVDGVAAALLGQDEPNRCPECSLLSAHKPFCSRPVRLPWEGEPDESEYAAWSDESHAIAEQTLAVQAETLPDESEYAVATDATWLSAVTGDVLGEVVHKTTVYDGGASGWCWGCSCGEGSIELAAEEYAQREAREHLDGVNARVATSKITPEMQADYHRRFPTWSETHGHFVCTEADCGGVCGRPVDTDGPCRCFEPSAEAGIAPESGTAVA